MAKLRTFRSSFAAGYIDPEFLSRSDAGAYHDGCEQLENFEVMLSGGVRRRAGTERMVDVTGNRIIAWEFDQQNKYIVSFRETTIHIHPVEGTLGPIRIVSNPLAALWPEGNLEFDYVIALNTLILVHPSMPPKVIRRLSDGLVFTIDDLEFTTNIAGAPMQPFFRRAETRNTWLSLSVTTGTGIARAWHVDSGALVRSEYFWQPSMVGRWYRYENVIFQVLALVETGPAHPEFGHDYDASVQIYGTLSDLQVLRLYPASDYLKFKVGDIITGTDTGATVEVIDYLTEETVQSTQWQYLGFKVKLVESWPGLIVRPIAGTLKAVAFGTVGISGEAPAAMTEEVSSGSVTSRTQFLEQTSGDNGASINWADQAWGEHAGYPGAIGLHGGRLWLGGSDGLPNYIWGSRAQDFFSFDVGDGFPDDAIAAPVTGNMMQRVRYIIDGPQLEIFTDQGEFYVPAWEQRPITPETFSIVPASTYGVLKNCKPVRMNYLTVFAEKSGRAVYRMFWDDQVRGYRSNLMTGQASSLVNYPLCLAVQRGHRAEGQEVCWIVNSDGTALQLRWWPDSGDQAVAPMSRRADSPYRYMAYVGDVAWMVVGEGNDTEGRSLERARPDILLDSFSERDMGSATTTFNLNPRYRDKLVDVLTDRDGDNNPVGRVINYLGEFQVDNLTLELPVAVSKVWVGYRFGSELKPTPMDVVPMEGDTRIVPKKVISYLFPLLDTWFVNIEGRNYFARQPADGSGLGRPFDNEDLRVWQLGYGQRRAPVLVCDLPLPCTVLGFAAEVEF